MNTVHSARNGKISVSSGHRKSSVVWNTFRFPVISFGNLISSSTTVGHLDCCQRTSGASLCLFTADADGDYQITTRSKAQIRYDGIVKWVCEQSNLEECHHHLPLESANDLQILLFHWYSILSIRRTKLYAEIRYMDLSCQSTLPKPERVFSSRIPLSLCRVS